MVWTMRLISFRLLLFCESQNCTLKYLEWSRQKPFLWGDVSNDGEKMSNDY